MSSGWSWIKKQKTVLILVFCIVSVFWKRLDLTCHSCSVFSLVRYARLERFCGESFLEPKRIGRSEELRSNASFHNEFPRQSAVIVYGTEPVFTSRRRTFRVRLNDGFVFTVCSDPVVDPFIVCATLALHERYVSARLDDTALESHGPFITRRPAGRRIAEIDEAYTVSRRPVGPFYRRFTRRQIGNAIPSRRSERVRRLCC